jgi:NTP pyrophosphatase (non-canonical NTP hydrolase)
MSLEALADKATAVCEQKGWRRDWATGGCHLHLEVSEFIESLRGKGANTPTEEAADVLFVLLSMCRAQGIDFDEVRRYFHRRCDGLLANESPR